MSKSVACPKCQTAIPVSVDAQVAGLICPECGAKIRMASKPKPKLAAVELPDEEPTDVPEAPDEKSRGRGPSDKPKKKKKKKQKGFALSPLALGGIIVGGLSLLLGIGYFAGLFGGGKGGDAKDPDGNRNFIVVKQSNAPLNDVEARKSLVASPFAKAENDAKPVELRDTVWPAFAPPPPRKYPALDAKSDPFQYRDTLLSVDADTVPIPIEADDAPPLTFLKDLRIDTGGFSDPNKAYPVEPIFTRNFRYAAVPSAINASHGLIFAPDKTNFLRFVLPMPVPAKELPKKNLPPKKDAKGKEIPPVPAPVPAVEAKPLTPLPTHGIYDLTTGKVVGRLPGNLLLMPDSRLSPDGKLLVLNGGANLEIWKADETKPAGILPLVGVVRWADFLTPTTFATFEIAPEGALVLWDLTTLQKIKTIPLPLKPVPEGTPPIQIQEKYILNKNGAAISPGGRFVAVPTPTELIVVDVRESKEFTRIAVRQNMGIERVSSLQFLSRPDRLLFSSDIEEILVWDLKTGQRDRIYAWYTPG